MSVAIVTPWYEHLELWTDYEEAISAGPPPDELIIVDNHSPEPLPFGTIRLPRNLGFAGGSNVGLHAATSDVVIFLNNDIIANRENWIESIVSAVEPGILVGPMIRSDEHASVDGLVMPYLDGWCLAGMREDLLELGGFDESLQEPSYYSDNMLCLEARAQGFTLREVSTGLIHKGGMTTLANGHLLPSTIANRVIYEKRVRELV